MASVLPASVSMRTRLPAGASSCQRLFTPIC
jgi:hypothetical protein